MKRLKVESSEKRNSQESSRANQFSPLSSPIKTCKCLPVLSVHSQVKRNPNTRDNHYQEQKETKLPVFIKTHKVGAADTKKQSIYCKGSSMNHSNHSASYNGYGGYRVEGVSLPFPLFFIHIFAHSHKPTVVFFKWSSSLQ